MCVLFVVYEGYPQVLRNVRPLVGVTPVRSSAAELTRMPVLPSASLPHAKKEKRIKKRKKKEKRRELLFVQGHIRARRTYSVRTQNPASHPYSSYLLNAVSHAGARLVFCSSSTPCCRAVRGFAVPCVACDAVGAAAVDFLGVPYGRPSPQKSRDLA